MNITITGSITDIFPEETRGSFTKRLLWLKTDGEYPQHYQIEMHKDHNRLDGFKAGDVVDCKCDLRGKQWTKEGKASVFNSIVCYGIGKAGTGKSYQQQPVQQSDIPQDASQDLPF